VADFKDLKKLINSLDRIGKIVTANDLDSKPRAVKQSGRSTHKAPPMPKAPSPARKQTSEEDEWDRQFRQYLNEKQQQEGRRVIDPLTYTETPEKPVQPAAPKPAQTVRSSGSAAEREWDAQFDAFLVKKQQDEENRRVSAITALTVPQDYKNPYALDERAKGVFCESIPSALLICLDRLGCADIEYIAQITGKTLPEVITGLKGLCFCDPEKWGECFYKGYVTRDEYLSGNMIRRYNAARNADKKYQGFFRDNVREIEQALPPALDTKDIYATLGSPWIPADVIDDFIVHMLGPLGVRNKAKTSKTVHDPITGEWEIPNKSRYGTSSRTLYYGTKKIGPLQLLEKLLNCRQVQIYETVTNSQGRSVRVPSEQETVAALECESRMRAAFSEWLWRDPRRSERMQMIYENNFSCVTARTFDGSYLTFPDMSEGIELYPFQKEAVAKIIFTPNTLLAHEVGSGKTYIMAAAGMKLRQIGLSKRNMFVVPNSLVGQWESIFRKLYPQADIICVNPDDFTSKNRQGTLTRIRDTDFDAVIIAYSCFDRTELSEKAQRRLLTLDYEEMARYIATHGEEPKALNKKRVALLGRIKSLGTSADEKKELFFDDLGITTVFLDEAHNYKNIPIESNAELMGVNTTGSKKCASMLDKIRFTALTGRGSVFATGTPITNSISDAYTMMRYLQYPELKALGLRSFDSWVGMFGEAKTDFEVDVDTSGYRMCRRLRSFHNLPELTALFSTAAHFHRTDGSRDIPECKGHNDCTVPRGDALGQYLREISDRAEKVRLGEIPRQQDNMLKITTDGRKAALDIRLVREDVGEQEQSKVRFCAENVCEIYRSDEAMKPTQLVFCDISTPKAEFNIYDELRRLLIQKGIPEKEIAFIHSYETDGERLALFDAVNDGRIRVLMGSTFKLGTGVNVQTRLKAVHHLDVPWRPADMVQREGRILRPGNLNKEVKIFRYITEGSFDAYSWQLLETKQSFISQLVANELSERSGSEVDGVVLDYAEVKALAVGNPLIKQRIEKANELSKLRILQRQLLQRKAYLRERLGAIPRERDQLSAVISDEREDLEWLRTSAAEVTTEMRTKLREALEVAVAAMTDSSVTVAEHRGFAVSLRPNMISSRPAVRLTRKGTYYTELGDSPFGYPIRIDNTLDRLPDLIEEQEDRLAALERENVDAQTELDRKEDHTAEIERLEKELSAIDERLTDR
jgi:N12 class adenine-specific DNA methylase